MIDPFLRYRAIYAGLHTLLDESQSYTQQVPKKLARMQEIFLQEHALLYDVMQIRALRYYQAAFAYKDLLVALRLEEMWSMVHAGPGDRPLLAVLTNMFDEHDISEKQLVLLSFALDDFVVQATAFLDFYALYLRAFFQLDDGSRLRAERLMDALSAVDNPLLKYKAEAVRDFLQKRVRHWSETLRKLRDSVVHRDILYPDFESSERLVNKIVGSWPERYRTMDTVRFAQEVHNDTFEMVITLAPMLYDLEWKAGPDRHDLW